MKNYFLPVLCFSLLVPLTFGQTAKPETITAAEAKGHIGEAATVCGKVVASHISRYTVGPKGKPITFDLDEASPNRVFTFVVWTPDSKAVEQTRNYYTGKHVCVSGTLTKIGNTPHMLVADQSHIKLDAEEKN